MAKHCSSAFKRGHFLSLSAGVIYLRFTQNHEKSYLYKSFGGKFCAFKRGRKKRIEKKKLSLLAEKLSLGKKVCSFEWCLVLSQKYTKSFGGKNLVMYNGFVPSKVKV